MAYSVPRNKLSEEQINVIQSMLTLYPQTNNKYQKTAKPEPIIFYDAKTDVVELPFLFAASLFQICPNIHIKYPLSNIKFTGTLWPNQTDVESKAWQYLQKYGTCTLGLYPGFGKTILGASLAVRTNLLICVIVHRELLTEQWKKTFQNVTNGSVWIVGEKNPPSEFNVIVCMNTRWHLVPEALRNKVGFLILDEAHLLCTKTSAPCILSFHPKYILVETATLEREDELHSMMYAVAGNHGIFIETNLPFSTVKINTKTKPDRKLNYQGRVVWHDLVRNTLFDERRNQIILNLVKENLDKNILIMTSLVEHVECLNSLIKKAGIDTDYMCGTKKSYVEGKVLVGSFSKLGVGFDQESFCPNFSGRRFNLLILVASIKKYSMLCQIVGRGFRSSYPTIFHLVDDDDIYKGHWYKCRKWYIGRGGTLTERTIQNDSMPKEIKQTVTDAQSNWIKQKTKKHTNNSTAKNKNSLTISNNTNSGNISKLTPKLPIPVSTQHNVQQHTINQNKPLQLTINQNKPVQLTINQNKPLQLTINQNKPLQLNIINK